MGKLFITKWVAIALLLTNVVHACPITLSITYQHADCPLNNNGWAKVNVAGGSGFYTFSWIQNGMNVDSISNLTPGWYNVIVSDTVGNCNAQDSVEILAIPLPLNIVSNTTLACIGDSVFITATGQYPGIYKWSGGDLVSPLIDSSLLRVAASTQTYYIEFSSAICDTIRDSITITVTNTPTISVAGFPDPACANMNSVLAAQGPEHGGYIWDSGSLVNPFLGDTINVSLNAPTTYKLDWFGPNCNASTLFTLNVVNLNLNITTTNPTCSNGLGSIAVAATGGMPPYFYVFEQGGMTLQNGPSNSLGGLDAGVYDISVVESSSGCISQQQIILVDEGLPIITQVNFSNLPIICCDDISDVEIVVTTAAGSLDFDFSWLHDASLLDSIAPGLNSGVQYTVQVVNPICGANVDTTFIIPGPTQCIAVDVDTIPDFCAQSVGQITLNITGGQGPYSVLWGDGTTNTTLSGLSAGNYNYIVTDNLGCVIVDNAVITERDGPRLDSVYITCLGFGFGDIEVFVNGKEPLTYFWAHDTINRPWDTGLVAGSFFLQVMDSAGCLSQVDTIVMPPANPSLLDLGPDTVIVSGQSIKIDAQSNQSNWVEFNWFTDETIIPLGLSAVINPDSTTEVILMLTNNEGCSTFDTIIVYVDNQEILVSLPNLFTPNNDFVNDMFSIIDGADKINNVEFQIFDRWGVKVYETRTPFFQWFGENIDGNALPQGVYVYFLEYETFENPGKKFKNFGDVTLIR